jgi:hypothetical protein
MIWREADSSGTREPANVRSGRAWWRWWHLAFVLPLAGLGILLVANRTPSVPQPIAFNHLKHTTDLQLACDFCHQYVSTGAHAGLPGSDICAYCHTARQGESAESARLTEMLEAGTPFRFNKLFRLPSHVYYTHRRHVGAAGLECVNCHGSIANTERPPPRPLVRVDMNFCLGCHRAREQTQDCMACHR